MRDIFLIWSNEHAAWWRPGSAGYTQTISKAGRYSWQQAERICHDANLYVQEDQEPNEVLVLAPECLTNSPAAT